MAFLVKNTGNPSTRYSNGDSPVVEQLIRVSRATDSLPATATETIFTVSGGRILLKGLIGEVTTAIQNQACNLSVVVDSTAGAADDLASVVSVANLGVGVLFSVEGDGTALLAGGIGWAQGMVGTGAVIAPGEIQLTTSATNTGSVKWDLYYLPLDPAAYVVPSAV
jgi:hypothetical protein